MPKTFTVEPTSSGTTRDTAPMMRLFLNVASETGSQGGSAALVMVNKGTLVTERADLVSPAAQLWDSQIRPGRSGYASSYLASLSKMSGSQIWRPLALRGTEQRVASVTGAILYYSTSLRQWDTSKKARARV